MLEHLFGSKTRVKMLRAFFWHTEKPWFVRELGRALDVPINAVRRELKTLVDSSLVSELSSEDELSTRSVSKKNAGASLRKYYQLNQSSLLFPEMQALLIKAQLLNEQVFIERVKEKAGDLSLFLLSGQFTGDTSAETDLLVVGKAIKERTLAKLVEEYERELGSAIRYTTMTEEEFFDRRQMMDKFIFGLFEKKHLTVIDHLTK